MGRDKLRTSREVYDQIRWDARVDDTRVLIGYEARGKGLEELPFREFVPEGEIPWHRLWYFRGPEGLLWDRKERIDRLLSLPAEPVPPAASSLTPLPSYCFEDGGWRAAVRRPEVSAQTTFKVLTFNVLFDLFDGEKLEPMARQLRLLEQLEASQPEVIALQEVTPRLILALSEKPWVRARYTMTEGPAAEGVTPYGVLLLSRIPITRVAEHRFTRDKRILVAELALAASPVAVAVVHFTSDRAQNGSSIRGRERHVLIDVVMSSPEWSGHDWLVVGDVNLHRFDGNEPDPFARGRLMDVWATLRGREPGFTFDPVRNPLARCTSSSGDRRRLDRVFLRKDHGVWSARSIELFGETRVPSDHFGLLCEIGPDSARERPVHTTALVLLPPESAHGAIQRLRQAHDRHFERWMPHLTLLFGFVPEAELSAAVPVLRRLLAARRGFRIRFQKLRAFRHRDECTVYATPEPSAELLELQSALETEFPLCQEQSAHGVDGYTPHLTLGQCTPEALEETLASWQGEWTPFEMEVCSLALIARGPKTAFSVRREVWLGTPAAALPARSVDALQIPGLNAWVGAHVEPELFHEVLGGLLEWARAREVDSQPLGYPGPEAWAWLTAAAFLDADSDAFRSPAAMLAHVFRKYAATSWQTPISLFAMALAPLTPRPVMAVYGLRNPSENLTETATWSTRAVLVDELQRAAELFGTSPEGFSEVLAPVKPWAGRMELPQGTTAPDWVRALEKNPLLRLRPTGDGALAAVDFEGPLPEDAAKP